MNTAHPTLPHRDGTDSDGGFTLVELLIVIVILGVLSTVTVFAVSGITSRGEGAASAADANIIKTAEESYFAQEGTYATEAELVSAGFMKDVSSSFDVQLSNARTRYTLVPTGSAVDATVQAMNIGGFDAEAFGTGDNTVVLVGFDSALEDQWTAYTETGAGLTEATMIYVADPDLDSLAELDTLVAAADFVVVAGAETLGGSGIAAHMTTESGADAPGNATGTWWNWGSSNAKNLTKFSAWWTANL